MQTTRPRAARSAGSRMRVSSATATTLTLDGLPPLLRRALLDCAQRADAGGVDEHVEAVDVGDGVGELGGTDAAGGAGDEREGAGAGFDHGATVPVPGPPDGRQATRFRICRRTSSRNTAAPSSAKSPATNRAAAIASGRALLMATGRPICSIHTTSFSPSPSPTAPF